MIRLDCRPNYFVVSSDVLKADLFFFHFPPTILHKENQLLCLADIKTEVSESVSKKSPTCNITHFLSNCWASSMVQEGKW